MVNDCSFTAGYNVYVLILYPMSFDDATCTDFNIVLLL